MEDTKPLLMQKPKCDSNLILNQIKEYKLINNDKEYLIQLGKTSIHENIGFKIKEISSDQKIIYDKYLSLEELQKISKSFRVFDNIDEALTIIEDIFQENNASIKSENDNLYINLQINKVGKGKEIVEIKLEKRAFSFKEMNEKLENDIKNLKIEIEDIKNNNKSLKEKIKNLEDDNSNEKNEINYLKKEIELLKKELEILTTNGKQIKNKISEIDNKNLNEIEKIKSDNKSLKEEIKNLKDKIENNNSNEKNEINYLKKEIGGIIAMNSKIINKKEELDLIENRLKYMEQFKNKNLSYNLIFRGTKDGKLPSDFHNKVDGKDKTITIIETTKGLKFGGYIDKKWDSSSDWIDNDENCFIFSLSLMKIYNPIKGRYKYQFKSTCGPNFSVFGLEHNLFNKSSLNICTKEDANTDFSGFTSDYELTGGENEFQVKELEVFQIKNK